MTGSPNRNARTVGDQQQVMPMTFADPKSEDRLRARLTRGVGRGLSVRMTAGPSPDVQGHALDTDLKSVWLNLQLEGDDTEGHAISVHFPSAKDADRFRRNLIATGILAGTIVIGSGGAIALSSQSVTPAVSDPVQQSQIYSPSTASGINPDTGKPWRSGFQDGSDAGAAGPADIAAPASQVVQRPAGRGPLETGE